jgi:ArsR family transcriptional regulator, arsenate/arsenite/antimonite-responsive transcriptional repressor / arsenate reductase (thioredoxin)
VARNATADARPPVVFRLAGDVVRWLLLSELAGSDQRVWELTTAVRRPQSLVSYHLGQLRSAGLVSVRRSSFDGRDSYYSLDLGRFGELLADAGTALHPALASSPVSHAETKRRGRPAKVLFLCTGNSARSQIAEALTEHLSGGRVAAASAGSRPKSLHPNAVQVLRERGIDIAGRRSKHLDEFTGQRFDYVITLCDRVREVCPEFPGSPDQIHWSIPDPARAGADDAEAYPAFAETANELAVRIPFLLKRIEHHTAQEVTQT